MLDGLVSLIVSAIAAYVTALIVPGITFRGDNKALGSLAFAVMLAVVNALVRPVLAFLGAPLTFVTFGLFSFVINAVALLIASSLGKALGGDGIEVDGFAPALVGAVVLAIVNTVIGFVL